MPSDTAVLPAVEASDSLPPAGTYALRRDRCVIEVSVRLLGLPITRRRLRPGTGQVVVGDRADEHALSFELVTKTLCHIRFATTEFVVEGRRRLRIVGWVDIDDTRRTLRMTARVVHVDTDTIVFAAKGVLAPPRAKQRATGVASRRMHIETAVEFSR